MLYRDWPELGRKVSAIALGTAHFGAKMPEETAFEVMDAYRKLGGNVLDTARVYGDFDLGIPGISEKTIGKWLASRKVRDDVIISTKGAHPPWGEFLTPRLDRASIESDMEESLEALGVPGVELYFSAPGRREPPGGRRHPGDAERPRGKGEGEGSSARPTGRRRASRRPTPTQRPTAFRAFRSTSRSGASRYQHHVADVTLIQMDKGMYGMHRRTGLTCMPYSSQAQGFFTKLYEMGEDGLSEDAPARLLKPRKYAALRGGPEGEGGRPDSPSARSRFLT